MQNAMQLEESEETRRLKHKTLPRHVSRDEHDARQNVHLQSKSRSGKTVYHVHRPQEGTHGGENRRRKDHFFMSNAAVLQRVKAVLNCLESGAVFSAMSEDGVEGPTNMTRLIKSESSQEPITNAERIERASF